MASSLRATVVATVCFILCATSAVALVRKGKDLAEAPIAANNTSSTVPAPSPDPDLPCFDDPLCGNAASVQLYQAHGWLMWLGFGLFMPLGIIASRHMQGMTHWWFYGHLFLQVTAVACIVPGAAIAFAFFQGIPNEPVSDPSYLHHVLGTAVIIMACLNFVLGFVRPHKGSVNRAVWYFFHFALGTVAVVLAWYTIYTGMNLYEDDWVFDTGSDLPSLTVEKTLFTISISVLGFIYLLLGRWEHMTLQRTSSSQRTLSNASTRTLKQGSGEVPEAAGTSVAISV